MKLYWGSGSPVSWRAQLAFALKGVPYESHRLDLGKREHRTEAYRMINPRGTFPVLVDGDATIRESLAIMAYLERCFPSPPLLGQTPAETGAVWQFVAEHDAGMASRVNTITQALFRDTPPDDWTAAKKAVAGIDEDLAELQGMIGHEAWLIGKLPSAADVVLYPTVHRLLRATSKSGADGIGLAEASLRAAYGRVFEWLDRLAELPGVDETYPPHWRAE